MKKNQRAFKKYLLTPFLLCVVFVSTQSQARGAFPEITNPGTCVTSTGVMAAGIQATAVLRKSQNVWAFILEVVGSNAAGTWKVITTKSINNVVVYNPTSTSTFDGGWAWTTAAVDKIDKGIINFNVKANNISPTGISCTANVSIKK
jgi:hypothetical protein